MPSTMNRPVPVTGVGAMQDGSRHIPRSVKEFSGSFPVAAKACAAIVHCHVRKSGTGVPSRKPARDGERSDRIRSADMNVAQDLTTGVGGNMILGPVEAPLDPDQSATDMTCATELPTRLRECPPEICTFDRGSMNFGGGGDGMARTGVMLRNPMGPVQQAARRRPA